jgi:SWI/SNF-related matrix-associated actin-dependent regulator of chromatin subfamily A3
VCFTRKSGLGSCLMKVRRIYPYLSHYIHVYGLILHYLAHRIRNRTSDTFEAACSIQARNRWCLTGTPIHNSLDDYGALLSFIQVSPFTSKTAFDYWIAKPIKQQQPRGLERFRKLVSATCLRRTKDLIKQELRLPPRIEREESIELDTSDRELYDFIRARTARFAAGISSSDESAPRRHSGNILPIINHLRRICNHGVDLLPPDVVRAWQTRDSAILDRSARNNPGKKCDACKLHDNIHHSELGGSEMCNIHVICQKCATQWYEYGSIDEENPCPVCSGYFECGTVDTFASADATMANTSQTDYKPSAKIRALLRNLTLEQQPNLGAYTTNPIKRSGFRCPNNLYIKLLLTVSSIVFSYWTGMLGLVARALRMHGFIFQRVDGQTDLSQRIRALELFDSNPSCTVMLASIGSIGEGYDTALSLLFLKPRLTFSVPFTASILPRRLTFISLNHTGIPW